MFKIRGVIARFCLT